MVANGLTAIKPNFLEFFRGCQFNIIPGWGVLAGIWCLSGYMHVTPRDWPGAGGVKSNVPYAPRRTRAIYPLISMGLQVAWSVKPVKRLGRLRQRRAEQVFSTVRFCAAIEEILQLAVDRTNIVRLSIARRNKGS